MTDLLLEEAGSGEEVKQVCVLFLNYIEGLGMYDRFAT